MSSFSYGNDPLNDPKDELRLLIGDTNPKNFDLTDDEICYFLETEGSTNRAAVTAAESLAVKFARLSDETVGRVGKKFSQKAKQMKDCAKMLKRRADSIGVVPFAGGISISDKQTSELDSDRVDPNFNRNMHENVDAQTKPHQGTDKKDRHH